MLKSMTAFGRAKHESDGLVVTIEMKSVNSRFFDCSVKLPRSYMHLEEKIKSYIQKSGLSRGKVDVFINVTRSALDGGEITIDTAYADKYIAALRALRDTYQLHDDISVMTVARNQDVFKIERADTDADEDWAELLPALSEAVCSHSTMRTAEGDRIRADIIGKIENIRSFTKEVSRISETDTVGYRDKLEERLRKILDDNSVTVDENRLLTECAVWCEKIAIDEELVRLNAHFDAFYEILELPEPSGRKLDFLVQELNRETNTIGSKCNNSKIARIVVDMKGEIEKIREQIQNIE